MSGLRKPPDWLKKIVLVLLWKALREVFRRLAEWAWDKVREMDI
ncbi:hypothetical protein SAMN04490183_1289 [Pseudomonas corrugata]|nr:hypothetical protein SAMN04490183_1289 [Pseudomonas corrugata]